MLNEKFGCLLLGLISSYVVLRSRIRHTRRRLRTKSGIARSCTSRTLRTICNHFEVVWEACFGLDSVFRCSWLLWFCLESESGDRVICDSIFLPSRTIVVHIWCLFGCTLELLLQLGSYGIPYWFYAMFLYFSSYFSCKRLEIRRCFSRSYSPSSNPRLGNQQHIEMSGSYKRFT